MATPHPDPADRPKGKRPTPHADPGDAVEPDHRAELEALIRAESGSRDGGLPMLADEQAARLSTAPKKIEHRFVEDENLVRLLAEQHGMEYVDLGTLQGIGKDPKILTLIPAAMAKEYKVLPLRMSEEGDLIVAISDPLDVTIADNLHLLTGHPIRTVIASEEEILDRIELHYGMGDESLEKMVEEIEAEGEGHVIGDVDVDLSDVEAIANEPTVIKLVNLLLLNVIKDRASDLHIEPFGGTLRIRHRVDGVLREIPAPPKSLQTGVISRFKVMANMNIAETRRPQDGRIRLTLSGREVDLRVSTLPTVHGESMVMRILDKSMMMLGLDQIGMSDDCYEKFAKVIKKPNGIVLVTGPTGSGKTTTLYAAIQAINDPGEKLITTEDPVEYQVPGLIQVNINENVGLTFAACLRAILRQDPDTILVGEIRDIETAQIAIQASLTGHLVFSTLHTNSAAATVSRLIDMGIEPFLLTSTLEAIIGQRLVRTVCPSCAEVHRPTPEELLEFDVTERDIVGLNFVRGSGCEECSHTGYKGRLGLFEILVVTDAIRDLILERATADEIQARAVAEGMTTMRQDGWLKAQGGITSLKEIAHHTPREQLLTASEMDASLRQQGHRESDRAPISPAAKPAAPSAMPWEDESAGHVEPNTGTEGAPYGSRE
ncbi:MAG: Flp pilus assembly complex ATPase component TadA [Candidatus Sumerlaeia bacterium]|nr:Flp pilus assembly complex ATPase component TadA [Candidatus Sumerlaeia bacterium]